MLIRLHIEHLETRDNPSGPELIDPIGVPVASAPPSKVLSEEKIAPDTTEKTAPDTTEKIAPIDVATQKIIDTTISAITRGW